MDSSEIEGELEMLSAMYSDSMTIISTDLDNLHRIESGEIISPNGKSKCSPSSSSAFPTTTSTTTAADNGRTIINLRLRKNVEIELAFPSKGYYSSAESTTKKVRLDVLNSPANIDSEKLLSAMKKVVKEHNVGEGALLISICQAAEQYVDGVLVQSPSTITNSNRFYNENDGGDHVNKVLDYCCGEGDDDDGEQGTTTMMMMAKSNSSKMTMMISSNSTDFYPLSESSDSAIFAELAKRKCVRGSNPISDKGSKFLAHCAPISCEREAREIIALVREIKSISQACHPCIWAYRFTNPQTKVVHYDCDDDGEKNGAKSILFVMEQMKVDGYICTCTRFFGGTMLGPIRFRYISQATRSVIEEAKAAGPSK